MASQTILALAALVCLAALAIAQPVDDDMQVMIRNRRAAARRGSVAFAGYATHTQDAPSYASPEEDAEEEDTKPQRPGRARPSRPQKPQEPEEDSEEEDDDGAPPSYENMGGKGATAIATSYSRGNGASSKSHATAYGGQFSGGMFRHSYGK